MSNQYYRGTVDGVNVLGYAATRTPYVGVFKTPVYQQFGPGITCNPFDPALAKSNGPLQCPQPATSNPISLGNGNKWLVDLDVPVQANGFGFTRTYNSNPATVSTVFGANWRMDYGQRLGYDVAANTVWAFRPDGKAIKHVLSGGIYAPDADIADRLYADTSNGGAYRLHLADQSIERYDTAGKLLSRQHKDGITQTLTYSDGTSGTNGGYVLDASGNATATILPAGLLIKVIDTNGRSLQFGYDAASRIVKLLDPASGVYRYVYDASNNLASVTYPDGKNKTYWYGESAYTSGANLPNALTGITDENGVRYITYTYDSTGRAIGEVLAGNVGSNQLAFGTNSTTLTDPLGTPYTYTFQTLLGVTKSTGVSQPPGAGCSASSSSITYDANGNIATRTDFNNNLTTYTYDLTRNLETKRVEASGKPESRTISTAWHNYWRLPLKVAEPQKLTTWAYNGDAGAYCAPTTASVPGSNGVAQPIGVVCQRTEQATTDINGSLGFTATTIGTPRTWSYTYNSAGQVLTLDGPRTDVIDRTTLAYYSDTTATHTQGDLATLTNALGHVTQFATYDKAGRPLTFTDPNTVTTTLTYWPRGWLKSRSLGGQTTTYDYDDVGQLTRLTLGDGSHTDYTYDAAHRLTAIADTLGNAVDYTLDPAGNITHTAWKNPDASLAKSSTAQYDALGRPQTLTDGLSHATTQTFDANGNLTGVTDPKIQSSTRTWDALNRPTRLTDAASGITTATWNGLDHLSGLTAPNNAATTYVRDGLGNIKSENSADRGTTSATYDDAGNLKTRTDARGLVANLTYDALNRPLTETYPATGQSVSYTWDSAAGCANGSGRLCRVTDSLGSTTYAYDPRGNRVSETRVIGSVSLVTQYSYDAADRLVTLITPGGKLIGLSRDSGGRIQSVSAPVAGASVALAQNIQTNVLGETTAQTLGNGVTETRSFDAAGQADSSSVAGGGGGGGPGGSGEVPTLPEWGAILLGLLLFGIGYRQRRIGGGGLPPSSFGSVLLALALVSALAGLPAPAQADEALSYDANGNIVERIGPSGTTTYGYDRLDRLNSEAGPQQTQTLTYDANGNRLSDASGTHSYTPISDRQVTIAGQTVSLDAAGYITQARGLGFVWDAAGQLKEVRQGSPTGTLLASYAYDGYGRRIRKVTTASAPQGAATVLYLYDLNDRLLMEADAAGTPLVTYVWRDDIPVSLIVNGSPETVLYLETDHLNTPRAARNQQKAVVWRWESDAFGSTLANEDPGNTGTKTTINLRFPGQYFDRESGLHYNMARYYDPKIGRYMSSDPIGLAGGLNTYSYVSANPLGATDPLGLFEVIRPGGSPSNFQDANTLLQREAFLRRMGELMQKKINLLCKGDRAQLQSIFDNWKVYVDPNANDINKRARGAYAYTSFRQQQTQFNRSMFDSQFGVDPSASFIFAHEFRHLMDANNGISPAIDFTGNGPGDRDADAWAKLFTADSCTCGSLQ